MAAKRATGELKQRALDRLSELKSQPANRP
jgi:hypothetical protein